MRGMYANPDAPEPSRAIGFRSVEQVPARAIGGIQPDDPLIVTHPELRPIVEDYFRRTLDAFDRAAAAEEVG